MKNLYPVAGRPLLVHTGEIVRSLPFVDRAVVSTDHQDIADAARMCGLDVPFARPPELSGDLIGDTEVLCHALQEMERIDDRTYDVIVMLQPTCPLRRPEHVRDVVTRLVESDWDSVWTVTRTDIKYHPFKQLVVAPDGAMTLFDDRGKQVIARQQLQPTFTRNGAAYAIRRACLSEQQTTLGLRSAAVVIEEQMVSIDTVDDFRVVERELAARASGKSSE
jgi:CMP-N,N'-diacetyllegionaminic acid synthase